MYREKRFVRKKKEMNQKKKKIFRVYVLEKRTAKGAPRIFFKNRCFGIKKQPTKQQKHTEHIVNI